MPSALPVESRRPARGHDPVLADEVVRLLAPRPGDTVVDATFGAGGHARRLAPALGQDGRYIAIDQDPEAVRLVRRPRRGRRLRDPLHPGQLRRGPAAARRPGRARRRRPDGPGPLVDAGGPARARLLLLAPGAARHAHGPGPRALGRRPRRRRPPSASSREIIRTYGEERYARQIARAIVRRRARRPSPPPASWSRWSARRSRRRPCSRAATRPSASSRRCGSPSTTSCGNLETRPRGGLRPAGAGRADGGDRVPLARGPAGEGVHARPQPGLHLPARPAGLRLRPRGRGGAARAEGADAQAGRAGPQPAGALGAPARAAARRGRAREHPGRPAPGTGPGADPSPLAPVVPARRRAAAARAPARAAADGASG